MARQYTFQSLSIPHAVIIIKYYKHARIQHPMWQFDKALRLDLYGQDDVCTNTANNIRSMVFTVTTSTKKIPVLATFSRVYSTSDSISLCSMYSCQYITLSGAFTASRRRIPL